MLDMRIGIPFRATHSVFDSGHAQAVLAVAEVCKAAGHDVVLVQQGTHPWWRDAKRPCIPAIPAELLTSLSPRLNLLIDVEGRGDVRGAERHVALLRKDPSLVALEEGAYLSDKEPLDLTGFDEVWVWDAFVSEERVPLVLQLVQKPVRRVPYVWTPALMPLNHEQDVIKAPYAVFVGEKNDSVTSSCIVPVVGAARSASCKSILIGNGIPLIANEYFQANTVAGLDVDYTGRRPYTELKGQVVVSHVRFVPFRPGLLDLLWLEQPLVHNCAVFKSFGTYYEGDDAASMAAALDGLRPDCMKGARAFAESFAPVAKGVEGWKAALEPPVVRIAFTDMWEGFHAEDNALLDLVRAADPGRRYVGTEEGEGASLLICGPFGDKWQTIDVPKVFFLGEPFVSRIEDDRLSLVLSHDPVEDERHMRLPLWPLFLSWFGQPNPNNNPNQLPLTFAMKPCANTNREFCAFVVSNPCCEARNAAFDALNAYKKVNSGGLYKNNIGGSLFCKYGGGGGGDAVKFEFLRQHRFCICYENTRQPGYVTEKLLHAKMAGCVPLYWGALEAAADFDPSGFVHMKDGDDIVDVVRRLEADPDALERIQRTPALDTERLATTQALLKRVGERLVALTKQKAPKAGQESLPKAGQESLPKAGQESLPKAEPKSPKHVHFAVPENDILEYNPLKPSSSSPLFVSFATAHFLPSLTTAINSVAALKRTIPALRFRAYVGSDVTEGAAAGLQERFPWITVKRLPEAPVDFPDMFEPKYFGWKLAILKEVCHDPDLEGDAVIYADAGVSWIAMPDQMLQVLDQTGVCLVSDPTQINRRWCSPAMIKAMQVTEAELNAQQLQAAAIGFVAGSADAVKLFDEAFTWGSKRDCLFGDYAIHRHDQSILSVLSLRHKIHTIDLNRFHCRASLRKAYQKGVPSYHHRGKPVQHEQVLEGIDDVWVVSLERRFDRWKGLLEAHPGLGAIANRLPAVDGKLLDCTQNLYNLFARNDFQWKKSVMGCALSHIMLWAQLVCEHPSVNNYLILEDDCRFVDVGWKGRLKEVMDAAPADAELLLLGGVLPGNLAAYPSVLEPVNRFWATIRPNSLFTGGRFDIDHFHFCAYSYVLTRAGAAKLLATLQQAGCYTSIDHYLCHPNQGLKKVVLRNLMTTCYQAADPAYQKAAFDEMLRVDGYDSDIWNNKECFDPVLFKSPTYPVPLWPALVDVLKSQPHSIQTRNTLRESPIAYKDTNTVYVIKDEDAKIDGALEEPWIRSFWPNVNYVPFPSVEAVPADSWLLVCKPLIGVWEHLCQELNAAKKPFKVLHLSDEAADDSISIYDLEFCTRVVRNYARPGLGSKVTVIPLGYATPCLMDHPEFSERPLVWGFHGADWKGRREMLAPLMDIEPHECVFREGFSAGKDVQSYSSMLLKSKFAPVPRGNHAETFRLWEALEHGCVPIYVRCEGDEVYWTWLRSQVYLMDIGDWTKAAAVLRFFMANPDQAEQYRKGILEQWIRVKEGLRRLF